MFDFIPGQPGQPSEASRVHTPGGTCAVVCAVSHLSRVHHFAGPPSWSSGVGYFPAVEPIDCVRSTYAVPCTSVLRNDTDMCCLVALSAASNPDRLISQSFGVGQHEHGPRDRFRPFVMQQFGNLLLCSTSGSASLWSRTRGGRCGSR